MGQSTNAILCWGIDFGEELPWEEKAEELGRRPEDDEFLAHVFCDVIEPKVAYEEDKEAHRAYWRARGEALEGYGIELVSHCSGDYPMYILAIADSNKTASRGSTVGVTSADISQPEADGWQAKLAEACEKLGIEPRAGGWLLCSMWN